MTDNDEHRDPIEGTRQSTQAEEVDGDLVGEVGKALLFNAVLNNGNWPKQTRLQSLMDLQATHESLAAVNDLAEECDIWHRLIETAVVRVATLVADRKIKLAFTPGDPPPADDDLHSDWKPAQWEYFDQT